MTIDIDELLPCPFCGCEVELVLDHTVELTDWIRHKGTPCGVEFSGQRGEVIAAWNSRSSAIVEEPMAVGEAGTMPGTDGFTMAAFRAADVPIGTKLFASPQPHTGRAGVTEEMVEAGAQLIDPAGIFNMTWQECQERSAAVLNTALTVEPEAGEVTPLGLLKIMQECGYNADEPHPEAYRNFSYVQLAARIRSAIAP